MSNRKSLPKGIRFYVLNRDGFACQYCGAKDVELHVDHVVPVSQGGSDDPSNLSTACAPCNLGKSARLLLVMSKVDWHAGLDESRDGELWKDLTQRRIEAIPVPALLVRHEPIDIHGLLYSIERAHRKAILAQTHIEKLSDCDDSETDYLDWWQRVGLEEMELREMMYGPEGEES